MLKRLNSEGLRLYNETLQEQLKLGIIEIIPHDKGKVNTNSHLTLYLQGRSVTLQF